MIKFLIALLLVQAFYCAEFPDLNNHVQLTWNNVSLEQKFDSSQTVHDIDGNVNSFILCSTFNNTANSACFYDYSFAQWNSFGAKFSASGSGNFTIKNVARVNETYACMEFFNPVSGFEKEYGFMKVYGETVRGNGEWEVNYSCSNYVLHKKFLSI